MRNGGCRQFLTLHLCHSFLITVFTCSGMNFLPWNTALYRHLQHRSYPWSAVLEELLQNESYPWGTVLQKVEEKRSSKGPSQATVAPCTAASFEKVLDRQQHGYLYCILPWTAEEKHDSPFFIGWRWTSDQTHGAPPSSFLSNLSCCMAFFWNMKTYFSEMCFHRGCTSPAGGLSCSGSLWTAWNCPCPAQGSPWSPITEATPASSLLPKLCQVNQMHLGMSREKFTPFQDESLIFLWNF